MNRSNDILVLARVEDYGNVIGLQIRDASGKAIARAVTLEPVGEDEHCGPTLNLSRTAGQRLMDELYACGIRPTEAAGSAGQKEALERHLGDMRKLVFEHWLSLKGPA